MTVDLEDFGLPAGSTGARRRLGAPVGRRRRRRRDRRPAEETPPSAGTDFVYPFTPFTPAIAGCTADGALRVGSGGAAHSWQTNREQNGVQAFYLVSRFHDHLAGADVGFTDDSGNFEVGGTGGDDPVLTQTDDGADTGADGGPDADHSNNANMSTPPDGAAADDADVPVPRTPARPTRSTSAASTAATTPASSGTSTRTASPTAW